MSGRARLRAAFISTTVERPARRSTLRNYPGHAPLLANCDPAQTTACSHPTITCLGQSYLTFEGLHVVGAIYLFGGTGLVVSNNDVTQGWEGNGDGNWAGIRLESEVNALAQGNVVHDISVTTGGGAQSSLSCIKMFKDTGAIIENNTCLHVADSEAGGIDDKDTAVNNIHRFNYFDDVPVCVRVNNQGNSSGVQIYGNVCRARGGGILFPREHRRQHRRVQQHGDWNGRGLERLLLHAGHRSERAHL